jgi:hypothetical protein
MNRLTDFTTAYIECALWCGVFNPARQTINESHNYSLTQSDISATTLRIMREDCTRFWEDIKNLVPAGAENQAGHDFWFTRNGHGAGFWDRGVSVYGSAEIRDNLNVLCKNFRTKPAEGMPLHRWGDFELYIGDDGRVYHV